MKLINKIFITAVVLFCAWSCVNEESPVSTAVLTDISSLTFEAKDAPAQSFNLISEGEWTIEAPEWVSTDIVSGGAGESSVSVTVDDNFVGEQMQLPRKDTLWVKGLNMYAHAMVIINQKGDTYLGAKEGTVSEAVAAEAGAGFGLKESQVVAVSDKGFIVTDGKANIYINTKSDVKVGDKVTLKGLRSSYNGLPSLSDCENIVVNGTGTVQHMTALDLSTSLGNFKSTSVDYVAVKGATLVGTQIISTDGGKLVFLDTPASFNVSGLNAHFVDIYGYYMASDASGNGPFVVVASIDDKGVNENVKLPVTWLAASNDYPKWGAVLANGATKGVIEPKEGFGLISYVYGMEQREDDSVDEAAASKLDVSGSNPRANGVWTGDYWEFMSYVPAKAGQIIKLEFECRISQGGMRYWKMQYRDGNEWRDCRTPKSEDIEYTKDGKAEVKTVEYTDDLYPGGSADSFNKVIRHAVRYENDTDAIQFRWICMFNYTGKDVVLSAPDSGSMRLDCSSENNVQPSISLGTEADLPNDNVANVEVTVANNLTFEALPTAPKSFTVLSDNDVKITKDADWIKFVIDEQTVADELAVPAGQETEVKVICLENTAPETREGIVTVTSGATVEKVTVTQVSPGVKLDPFISIAGGNSGKVTFEAGTLNLKVQTNVDIRYSADASWVTVEAAPETKALVDFKQLVVKYEANPVAETRTAKIRVYNETENLETVYTLVQDAFVAGVYFQDDFSWIAPMADADSAGDAVGTDNPGSTAPNVWKMTSSADFFAKFLEIGYGYIYGAVGDTEFKAGPELVPNASVGKDGSMYIQENYLKFGQGSYNAGLVLPALVEMKASDNILIEFDWCWQVTGTFKPDLMTLSVDATVGTFVNGTSTSDAIESSQSKVDGESHLAWQHVAIVLNGATAETVLTIRPTNPDAKVQNAARGQNRWYLDNIKISEAN